QPFRRARGASRRRAFGIAAVVSASMVLLAGAGMWRQGFEGRVEERVLALDRARNPMIPFKSCDGRLEAAKCELGAPMRAPSILIWGDSHALSWAPAADSYLKQSEGAARLVVDSACPPIVGA